ncbi:MAG: hypothetical protein ACK5LT_13500 [Lachnospirales bacterium]
MSYIKRWLVKDFPTVPFSIERYSDNQLTFEKMMREEVFEEYLGELPNPYNDTFSYHYTGNDYFVDGSNFYPLPVKVERFAYTELQSKSEVNLPINVWTYSALEIWLNGEKILILDKPVYKPIIKKEIKLNLKKGLNKLFLRLVDLGVRDTRSLFGIEIFHKNIINVLTELHDFNKYIQAENYLENIKWNNGLIFSEATPFEIILEMSGKTQIIEKNFKGTIKIEDKVIKLFINFKNHICSKKCEFIENIKVEYLDSITSVKEGRNKILELLWKFDFEIRPNDNKFTIYHILCKLALGGKIEDSLKSIKNDLNLIESRIDCSDFLLIGIIRLMKNYTLTKELSSEILDVIKNYRYWMDENGKDGMCFWSENHSLMFYGCQLIIGNTFPEELFYRSGRTGQEQYNLAYKKVEEWLDNVFEEGFEEFLSGSYMCVTTIALLNIIDFADDNLSKKAICVLDILLTQLCKHTFKGTVISPQGRVYRDIIYPFTQGEQSLINYISPLNTPYIYDMWISAFATTKYIIPEGINELINSSQNISYKNGNAEINLTKNEYFALTSVSSPKSNNLRAWDNICDIQNANKSSFHFTKSLNEKFHGTTFFQPGVYGYQQHMWTLALDNDTLIFINHPGGTFDDSKMRPGYWYGNGIMPAIKQVNNYIMGIYNISHMHPIDFTHLFFPMKRFDKVVEKGQWLFARKNKSFLGIWTSCKKEKFNDVLYDCEFRMYNRRSAFVAVCDSTENCSFEEFMEKLLLIKVSFNILKLEYNNDNLEWIQGEDRTQYI